MENMLFDMAPDRRLSPASKFNPVALKHIFGTDKLYPFWIADQDFRSPECVLKAMERRIRFGIFGYEYKPESFWEAVTGWYDHRYGYALHREYIQFTPTIMTTVAMGLELFTDEGSGVILQTPAYTNLCPTIEGTGRTVVPNPLLYNNSKYELDFEDLEKTASRTDVQALVFCSPHNPSGRVWTLEELTHLCAICEKHNLLVISDEIHADIVYYPHRFIPMMEFHSIHDQLIAAWSPSKTFNLAGISDSMAIIPDDEMRQKFNALRMRYNLGRTNTISRAAMQAAYRDGEQWVENLLSYLKGNIGLVSDYLHKYIPEIVLTEPEGTYLLWMNISALPTGKEGFCRQLAVEAGIGLNDGPAFCASSDFVRMNIACPRAEIHKALERLRSFVEIIRP